MNVDPAEAAARLFEKETSSPIAIFFSQSEDDMKVALKQPWVAVCSDSGAVVTMDKGAHPRAYGTFPRVFRYVREEKLITLEEAVRKMTSLAASRAFLKDRGILRAGMKADITVFDPNTIRDVSTYEDPHHFSRGRAPRHRERHAGSAGREDDGRTSRADFAEAVKSGGMAAALQIIEGLLSSSPRGTAARSTAHPPSFRSPRRAGR